MAQAQANILIRLTNNIALTSLKMRTLLFAWLIVYTFGSVWLYRTFEAWGIVASLAIACAMVIYIFARIMQARMERSIKAIASSVSQLAEYGVVENMPSNNEFLPIANSLKKLSGSLQLSEAYLNKIGNSDFSMEISESQLGYLGKAMQDTANKLKVAAAKDQKAKLEMHGLLLVREILETANTVPMLGQRLSETISTFLGLECVAVWMAKDVDAYHFAMTGTHGHANDLVFKNLYSLADATIAKLAASSQPKVSFGKSEQSSWTLEDSIDGPGHFHFLVCPLHFDKKLYGFIELGSSQRFTAEQMRFPQLITEKIAIAVMRIRMSEQTLSMLHEEQALTEELRQQEEVLQEMNADISNQHAKLSESIHYASHIQQAVMPAEEDIRAIFPDSFLINKPRDMVSGDFPWLWKHGQTVFFAVADCTGHGVPGAIISMMGYFILNQIVGQSAHEHPATLLSLLDAKLSEVLEKDAEFGHQISMDIVLCKYDMDTHTLDFASAYRPLVLHTSSGIKVWKGDRKAVGGTYKHIKAKMQEAFTAHTIKIASGDSLILFSDGYVDQFGGTHNSKFLMARLHTLLERQAHLPMPELGNLLYDNFTSWRGRYPQIDDLLMLGIRLIPKGD